MRRRMIAKDRLPKDFLFFAEHQRYPSKLTQRPDGSWNLVKLEYGSWMFMDDCDSEGAHRAYEDALSVWVSDSAICPTTYPPASPAGSYEFEHWHELGEEILAINRANGWDVTTEGTWAGPDKNKIPAICAMIHSEVSEALEAYRKGDEANFIEEMADTVIRVLDCTAGIKLPLRRAIQEKLEKNRKRGYRHGGKVV